MRLATFNVENMFERAAIMNLPSNQKGRQVLADYYHLSDLIQKQQYSQTDKNSMLKIMKTHKGLLKTGKSEFIVLNEIRGHLIKRHRHGPEEIEVNGRNEWIGWFELKRAAVDEMATENTARVMGAVKADVLCVVEVEDRIALNRFNNSVIPKAHGQKYAHIMVIDGNDDRGIDVGIMAKLPFDIRSIGTHVDDVDAQGQIFSRDCAEYNISTQSGNMLLVLVNHFKSQGHGKLADNDNKRRRQATRVREIYEERRNQGVQFIAVTGDLNDSPDHDPLQPLIGNGSTLVDVMKDPKFIGDGLPGTYNGGRYKDKFDYVLMSPELLAKMQQGGIERRGVWRGEKYSHFPEVTGPTDAASDHAALWVDIDI
jgi:endonuclease/exonuclease/phosphatase family metal-dependent hydrolase